MHTVVWAILLALVATAGCLGDDDAAADDPVVDDAAPEDPSQNVTSSNTPPTATLSASIEQGSIPFNVTFDLDGSDADGDALSWTLDADGDGTPETKGDTLPANHTHMYETEGLYNVTLAVSDGQNETTQTLQINATAAAAGGAGTTTQEVTAGWLVGTTLVGCFGDIIGVGYPEELDGIAYASFEVDPGTYGRPYIVEITTDAEQDSPGFSFLDADRVLIAGGFLGDAGEGTVPKGAVYGAFWTCAGAAMTGTYVAG